MSQQSLSSSQQSLSASKPSLSASQLSLSASQFCDKIMKKFSPKKSDLEDYFLEPNLTFFPGHEIIVKLFEDYFVKFNLKKIN